MKTRHVELLDGNYRPISETIGFFECDAERAAETFFAWSDRTYSRDGRKLRMQRQIKESLAATFDSLLPLTTRTNRWLFIQTKSNWCAYVNNNWRGTDPSPIASFGSSRLSCRGIRCTNAPEAYFPAVMLLMHRPEWNSESSNIERGISAMKDGSSWSFDTYGEPYPFEQVEKYEARRIRDRFTSEMLNQYLNEFGIFPFDESFYMTTGCVSYLIDIEGPPFPNMEEFSLEEVQAKL